VLLVGVTVGQYVLKRRGISMDIDLESRFVADA